MLWMLWMMQENAGTENDSIKSRGTLDASLEIECNILGEIVQVAPPPPPSGTMQGGGRVKKILGGKGTHQELLPH